MRKLVICLFVSVVLMSFTIVGIAGAPEHRQGPKNDKFLTEINWGFMVKSHEAYHWHLYKDRGGATYSGSPSWKSYMEFLEWKLEEYGVRDIQRNAFTYNRWYTTDWPGYDKRTDRWRHNRKWTLTLYSDKGKPIPINVASYGAYSGSTPEGGVTAPLVYSDATALPLPGPNLNSLVDGKIVVVTLPKFTTTDPLPPAFLTYGTADSDYMSDSETIPPIGRLVPPSTLVAGSTFYFLGQSSAVIAKLRTTKAAGIVIVWDSAYDTVAGFYTFGVPAPYSNPTLYLGRVEGAKVVADAAAGKTATLKLLAEVEPAETYQLIGYLPGKNYGKPEDEQIVLKSHSDGPSLCQENGGFGILGIIKYFSHIPQKERPRTLVVFITNTHFINGAVVPPDFKDWFIKNPDAAKPIVGYIATEMMGQQEWREIGEVYEPTGLPEIAYLWARNNQLLVDMAIKAVKDNDWPRCEVKSNERPGPHGLGQGTWFGEGSPGTFARYGLNIPGFATMQTTGAYWQTTARINKFDADLFCKQVATFAQLTGELMLANLTAVDPVWGILRTTIATAAAIPNSSPTVPFTPDTVFVDPTKRATLVNEVDAIFTNVKAGAYAVAIQELNVLKGDITLWIKPGTNQTSLNTQIDNAIAKLQAEL
jgi:hypothetical protein